MSVKNRFATRLKALRERNGLNQGQLAKKLGISRGSISFYENGDRVPDIETFDMICDFFNVSYDYLLGKSELAENNIEVKAIREYTHLTDENINNLHEIKEEDRKQIINDFIFALLKNRSFITEIQHYIEYVNIYIHAKELFYCDMAKKNNLDFGANCIYNDEIITRCLARKDEALYLYKKAREDFKDKLKRLDELCKFTEYKITRKLIGEIIDTIFTSGVYDCEIANRIDSLSLDDIFSGRYKKENI